ncbi:type IX secretion system membrane protein PorP/SprF [Wenyingzhuangia sp. 1_MG-2023]|nr:type IX secretion system membrane protein PorP/SprF [Wenyingzhuangia sp. 1_MG-2023]
MKKHKFCFLLLVSLISKICFAQQETQYTQYTYNLSSINPGALGLHNEVKIFGSVRSQWTGVEGAPQTQYLSIETPLNYKNLSLGLSLINDKIGPLTATEFIANVAYQVPIDRFKKISFGVRIGARAFNVDWSKGTHQNDDPLFSQNIQEYLMSFGAGIYYEGEKLFGGISSNNLLPNQITSANDAYEIPHYNILLGYKLALKEDLIVKPTLFTKIVDGGAINIETSTMVEYQEKLFGGLSYRYKSAIALTAGMQITHSIKVGYSYDISISETSSLNSSAHEILLIYTLKKEKYSKKYQRENRY